MEFHPKNVATDRLLEVFPAVLAQLKADPFVIVAARSAEGEEPEAVVMSAALLKTLGKTCDAYDRLTQSPEYGHLRNEVERLRRAVTILFGQLEKAIGEQGQVPASCLEAVFGKEVPARVVRVEGNPGWTVLSGEQEASG